MKLVANCISQPSPVRSSSGSAMIPALLTRMCSGRSQAAANARTESWSARSRALTDTAALPVSLTMPAAISFAAACGRRTASDDLSAPADASARASLDADAGACPGHDRRLSGQVDAVDHLRGGRGSAERSLQKLRHDCPLARCASTVGPRSVTMRYSPGHGPGRAETRTGRATRSAIVAFNLVTMGPAADSNALGTYLRARREQARPEAAGVPDQRNRRVPGLRRVRRSRSSPGSAPTTTCGSSRAVTRTPPTRCCCPSRRALQRR